MSALLFIYYSAPSQIYPLSLHDALPIYIAAAVAASGLGVDEWMASYPAMLRQLTDPRPSTDRKSTRLNSSHGYISYAVFCLKKKNNCITHASHTCSPTISTLATYAHTLL